MIFNVKSINTVDNAGKQVDTINGLGEDIVVESLAAGKTVVIDAKTGLVTIDGANAFDKVDLWEFPVLKAGETALTFSNTKARVTVRYTPMWI